MTPSLVAALVLAASSAPLPDVDRFLASPVRRSVEASSAGSQAWLRDGAVRSHEPRLGVPTMVFVPPSAPQPQTPVDTLAQTALAAHRDLWQLDVGDLRTLELKTVQELIVGPRIARFVQRIDGVEVFRAELNAAADRAGNLVALTGYVAPHAMARASSAALVRVGAPEAVAIALSDLAGARFTSGQLGEATHAPGGYLRFHVDGGSAGAFLSAPRTKRVFFLLPDALEPAWYVEGDFRRAGETQARTESYVISAVDGSLLYRHNATSDVATSYRVWADTGGDHAPWDGPQGVSLTPKVNPAPDNSTAPFVAPNLVTLDHGPISTNDPWLPAGATVTSGNNAQAYSDLVAPDGFSPFPDGGGDLQPDVTSANAFDRTYDVGAPPASEAQEKAAVVQMFYDVNFFHDWYYDVGFKEVDGNAQLSNYGRGGVEGDPLHAEGEDYSGRNNANMSTQSDGASPRMQMYVWDGPADPSQNQLQISAPAAAAGSYSAAFGGFGPQSFDQSGTLIVGTTTAGTTDGCTAYPAGTFNGSLAYIDRGTCTFVTKVKNAQNAGALGVVIGSNSASAIASMGGTDPSITIPSMLVEQATGATIKANAPVTARMLHVPGVDHDGTIDSSVIAHEWGHYINHRLIADANGLGTNFSNGLGEGWADTHALLLVVRAGDDLVASNSTWNGVYPLAVYDAAGIAANATYYGIRRYPYSTDLTKNPLTYKFVQDNVALPTSPAPNFGQDGAQNSEVHNTGEVWASMLWECYAAMLRDTQGANARFGSFTAAQDRWRMSLVAAYKLTPVNPTLLEARDAVIAALSAGGFADSPTDVTECWAGFAKRGAGTGATSPDRNDQNAPAVTESFATDGALAYVSASVTEQAAGSCDHDGIVGVGETGLLHVNVRNTGARALSQSQVKVSANNPAVGFTQGSTVPVPATQPGQTAEVIIPFTLTGLSQPTQVGFTATASDASLTATTSGTIYAWVEAQNGLAVSTLDDAEEPVNDWSPQHLLVDGGAPDFAWQVKANDGAPGHVFFGPDSPHTNDQAFVTPPLVVATTGGLSFTFNHRFALEAGPATQGGPTVYFDSAVIELSRDNGATWTDIGAAASPGYNQTTFTDPQGAPGGNPLAGRRAYAGRNPAWPALEPVTVNLGTAYQGATILIRFRVGSDQSGIDDGWEVDDVSFTGLANTPFNHLVADPHACVVATTTGASSSSSSGTVGSGTGGSTGGSSSAGTVGSTSAGSTGTSTAGSSSGSSGSIAGSSGGSSGSTGHGSTGHGSSGSSTTNTTGGHGASGSSGGTSANGGKAAGGGCGCGAGATGGLESGALAVAGLALLARRRKRS